MKPFKLNLSHFKKVASDDNTTTLRHEKDGHEFKINHKALSHDLKKQIEKLPHFDAGGAVAPTAQQGTTTPSWFNFFDSGSSMPQAMPQAPTAIPNLNVSNGTLQASNLDSPRPFQEPSSAQDAADAPMQAGQGQGSQSPESPFGVMFGPLDQAYNQMGHAITQSGAAQAMGAELEAHAAQAQQANIASADKNFQDQLGQLNNESQKLETDIAHGHIDPNHYVDTMSGGQKVATAIGLALGGIGSGLTHGPNVAAQFLQQQMQRDMQAQQANINSKNNLLRANLAMTGNMRAAQAMTMANLTSMYQAKIQQAAAQSQAPQAMANAQYLNGQMNMQKGQFLIQAGLAGAAGNGQLPAQYRPFLPKDLQERSVELPNGHVGLAPTAADAQKISQQKQAIDAAQALINNMEVQRKNNGVGIPFSNWSGTAGAEQAQLGKLIQSLGGDPKLAINPSNWRSGEIDSKIQALKNFIRTKQTSMYGNLMMGNVATQPMQGSMPGAQRVPLNALESMTGGR